MGQHDLSYRRFFAHRRMIEDLLREIVGEQWVDRIDLESGERVNTSFVSPRHAGRESDVIWKFSRRDGGEEPVYVYILMEFQSRPDPSMPVRLMGYVHNFYEDLMARQPASDWRKLPLVIPVVVYSGTEPWHVAEDLGEMDPSVEIYSLRLRYRLINESSYSREELESLRSPVAEPAWLGKVILPRLGVLEEAASTAPTLEELDTMLAESIDRWNREVYEAGRLEGASGILLRLLRSRFGALNAVVEARVRSAEADQILEWADRVLTSERLEDVFRSA